MLHVPVTNPVRKRQKTLRFLQAREIPVPGRTFEFPDGEQKRSADLVVVEVAEEGSSTPYRYVTVTDAGLPDKAFVTIYDGERKTAPKFKRGVTKTSAEARRKKKQANSHSISIPGYRHLYSLSSKPSRNWPFERFINESVLGGFLDSSRDEPGIGNRQAANCTLKWMIGSYGPTTIDGFFVKAAIYTKRAILPGEKLVFDYPWL
jgi:hypothetical protein